MPPPLSTAHVCELPRPIDSTSSPLPKLTLVRLFPISSTPSESPRVTLSPSPSCPNAFTPQHCWPQDGHERMEELGDGGRDRVEEGRGWDLVRGEGRQYEHRFSLRLAIAGKSDGISWRSHPTYQLKSVRSLTPPSASIVVQVSHFAAERLSISRTIRRTKKPNLVDVTLSDTIDRPRPAHGPLQPLPDSGIEMLASYTSMRDCQKHTRKYIFKGFFQRH